MSKFSKTLLKLFLPILSSACAVSCVEPIAMDPDEDLPVVVNCILKDIENNPSRDLSLELFYAKGKSKKEYVPITEAKVSLTYGETNNNDTIAVFHHTEGLKWEATFGLLGLGESPHLTVEIPGRGLIKAVAHRPNRFNAGSFIPRFDNLMSAQFSTLKSEKHYFWIWGHRDDECKEPFEFLFTDHLYADSFNMDGRSFFDLRGTPTYQCYSSDFVKQYSEHADVPLHKDFIRIAHPAGYTNPYSKYKSDDDESTRNTSDDFRILAGPLLESDIPRPQGHIHIYSVSEEYDRYLREVYSKYGTLQHDLTAIYSSDNFYTNIEGGLGIFGFCVGYD
ncbi:MAG: DUF4249 family protein [Bacteroidales bacterium]|nr:DUF4249 family protein [Bacteroidales bacterium]